MTEGTRSQAWLFWLGLGLSLAIHVGVAAHLLSRGPRDFGATDFTTTAISVEIEATDILDAPQQSASTDAAPGSAGSPGEITPTPEPEPEPEPEKAEVLPPQSEPEKAEALPPPQSEPEKLEAETPPPDPEQLAAKQKAAEQKAAEEAKIRDEEALRQAAVAEREKQEAEQRARDKARQLAEARARAEREAEAREEEQERRAEKAKQVEREAKQKRTRMGSSAGASGSRGAKAAAGRVSASQGDLLHYKGTLNAWIARNKPPAGKRGNVVVLLAVSPSGALISASIRSSSGDKTLDQIALAAMRGSSPFPKPPAGSTASQLRFTFQYSFK